MNSKRSYLNNIKNCKTINPKEKVDKRTCFICKNAFNQIDYLTAPPCHKEGKTILKHINKDFNKLCHLFTLFGTSISFLMPIFEDTFARGATNLLAVSWSQGGDGITFSDKLCNYSLISRFEKYLYFDHC